MSRKTLIAELKTIIEGKPNHWFDLHRPDGTFVRGSFNPIGIIRIAMKIPEPTTNIIKVYADKRLIKEVNLDTIDIA